MSHRLTVCPLLAAAILTAPGSRALAQGTPADTREALLVEQQADKAAHLKPYEPGKVERFVTMVEEKAIGGQLRWHPFFESAYVGGGFAVGAGYLAHVSAYHTLDVRGSITLSRYTRAEAEYRAPRLFGRRGVLTTVGGWRQATRVAFYGLGTANTSSRHRANYGFQQPYLSATLRTEPTRRLFVLSGGVELTQWKQIEGSGTFPSVEEIYRPADLAGLGASPTYFHATGTAAIDWRDSPGYTKRGGYYAVTMHDYADFDDTYGFREVDYDAIQHLPILREAWVLSFRAAARTTFNGDDAAVPFFMMPSLGGGSTLRGYTSWRFRDRNSLLLSADWRVLVNRFADLALFYDAGKVTSRRADLDLGHLKSDVGVGLRFHGPSATPLRIDVARGNEGLVFVFSAGPPF